MSDTPRTDDEEMSPRLDVECMIVSADFARQLERELAEARKQRDEWFEVFAKNLKEKGNLRDHLAEAQDKIEELVEIGLTQMDKERSLKRDLAEAREIVEMQKETMRQMREKYGFGERNVMRELRQEIENLNKIIDAATNSANASHLRAIEYQSQRDTLVEALGGMLDLWDKVGGTDTAYAVEQSEKALAAVKGGQHDPT